jgi:hypothetical protein
MMFSEWQVGRMYPQSASEKQQDKAERLTEENTMRSLEQSVEQDPTSANYEKLGDFASKTAHWRACFRAYNMACQIAQQGPISAEAPASTTLCRLNMKLGDVYVRCDDQLKAIEAFEKCLSFAPTPEVLKSIRETATWGYANRPGRIARAYKSLLEQIDRLAPTTTDAGTTSK